MRSIDNKMEQNRLKALLPAVMVSGTFNRRGESGLIEHSGLIAFDIDHVDNIEETFKRLINITFTAYCAKSARGQGYWGIFAISNKSKHKEHFAAMQLCFKGLGIIIDPAPSNVASLRGYSFDENAYFNHNARVFDYIYEAPVKPKNTFYQKRGTNVGDNPFDDFNLNGDIETILLNHGWTYQQAHDKGTRKRYSRPDKENGISADYCTDRRILYVFTNESGFIASKGYNPVNVFCHLECDNDFKLCAKKLKIMGYGNRTC